MSKKEAKKYLAAPDYAFFIMHAFAGAIFWQKLNQEVPEEWNYEKIRSQSLAYLLEQAMRKEEKEQEKAAVPTTPKKTPQDILKEKTSDFIASVEEVLDSREGWEDYSLYDELKKIDAAQVIANRVVDYYKPIRDEMQAVVDKAHKELVEGYSHMSIKERKQLLDFLSSVVADAEQYALNKKAVRKPKINKPKSAYKQVASMKYLEESKEYQIVSTPKEKLPGSRRVFLFNVKTRTITELVSDQRNGFTVKGTTIQGIDFDLSRSTKLRKPEEFLPIVQKKTPNQINTEWKKLTTKTNCANGRVNKDTIILRIMDK
jgi:hypothetical protein